MLVFLLAVAIGGTTACRAAEEKRLFIYNWSDFIGPDTIAKFEQLTASKLPTMSTTPRKLWRRGSWPAVPVMTWSAPRPIFRPRDQAGVYEALDKSKLTNWHNLDPRILAIQAQYDPGN
jgi:putrescine transport system substrate-binding protein